MFDPLREDTPARMRALAERWPKRIIACVSMKCR
jgi:hypothetical protein